MICCYDESELPSNNVASIINVQKCDSELKVSHHRSLPGGKKMNIETDPETDKIINRIGKMGEKPSDVIRRGFSYLNKDSNFSNQE